MSDLTSRVGTRTGGNADLCSVKGEIISGDGEQAVYLEPGPNGTFLMRDITAPEGVSWQPGAGVGLTGSDGVTVAANNATNDLVTGTTVAQVNEQVTGAVTIVAGGNETHTVTGDFSVTGAGADSDITLTSNGATGDVSLVAPGTNAQVKLTANLNVPIVATNGDITAVAANGGIVLDTTGLATSSPGEIDVIADTLVNVLGTTGVAITSGVNAAVSVGAQGTGSINLTTQTTGDINVTSNEDLNLTAITGAVTIEGNAGVTVTADINTDIGLGVSGTGQITATADDGPIALTCTGDGDVILKKTLSGTSSVTVGGGIADVNVALATTGANASITVITSGAGAAISIQSVQSTVTIDSGNSNVNISGGDNDGSGAVNIQPGTNSATRTFAIFDGVGSGQGAAIADAAGGTTIDTEARAAINALLARARVFGFIDI